MLEEVVLDGKEDGLQGFGSWNGNGLVGIILVSGGPIILPFRKAVVGPVAGK